MFKTKRVALWLNPAPLPVKIKVLMAVQWVSAPWCRLRALVGRYTGSWQDLSGVSTKDQQQGNIVQAAEKGDKGPHQMVKLEVSNKNQRLNDILAHSCFI